jgi:hypothetical protein
MSKGNKEIRQLRTGHNVTMDRIGEEIEVLKSERRINEVCQCGHVWAIHSSENPSGSLECRACQQAPLRKDVTCET